MKRLLPLFLLAAFSARAQTSTIDWANVHQTIDGFGAYSFGSLGTQLTSAQANTFFGTGTGQLGYTLLRESITNDGQTPGSCLTVGISCAGFGVQTGEIQMILAVNPQVRFWATSWSPPPAYKSNHDTVCNPGGGVLLGANYGDYATWLANYVKSMNASGISLFAISPQNEPDQCPTYQGATMSGPNFQTFIKTNLGPTFAANSITTPIIMPETSHYSSLTNRGDACMNDAACAPFVSINAWHEYDAPSGSTPNTTTNPYASQNKKYWETEASAGPGFGPSLCGGCWDPSIADGIMWAGIIDDRMAVENANAWNFWAMVLPSDTTDNQVLLGGPSPQTLSKRAYVLGQYAKFVRPGWVRINATHNPTAGVFVSSFKDPVGGGFAIVVLNRNSTSSTMTLSLANFPTIQNGTLQSWRTSSTESLVNVGSVLTSALVNLNFPAQSVTTFVGTTTTQQNFWQGIIDPQRAIDWTKAGLPGSNLPSAAWPVCATVAPYTGDSTVIQNALTTCHTANPNGGVVALGAGTFTLSNGITFPSNNLALRGQGASITKLVETGTGGTSCQGGGYVCIRSGGNPQWTGVVSGQTKGSTQLILSTLNTVVVGSILSLNQCETGFVGQGSNVACLASPNARAADNGGYYHCEQGWTAPSVGCAVPSEGGVGGWRANASEMEAVAVTAINAGGCGATCVTISHPIQQPDWQTGNDPTGASNVQAVIIQPASYAGVENLSIDGTAITGNAQTIGVSFQNVYHGWVSGVSTIDMGRTGVQLFSCFGCLVKDSYFYGYPAITLTGDHEAIHSLLGADNLIQNNICHATQACYFEADAAPEQADVFAYNYSPPVGGYKTTGMISLLIDHGAGEAFDLREGNIGTNINDDGDHGNHLNETEFRNLVTGWLSCANGGCAPNWNSSTSYGVGNFVYYATTGLYYQCTVANTNTVPTNTSFWNVRSGFGEQYGNGDGATAIRLYYGTRYSNIIGNVLGTPGWTVPPNGTYQSAGAFGQAAVYIWGAGQVQTFGSPPVTYNMPSDSIVPTTTLLWGNYDTFNATTRFLPSEVPTSAPTYPNPIPASQTLPASFYLSSRPTWFGSLPWPAIGPDVSNGNIGQCSGTRDVAGQFNGLPATTNAQCGNHGITASSWGGHANYIPAMKAYFDLGGLPDGTGPALVGFNASVYSGAPGPGVSLSPTSVAFGNQNINTTSSGQVVTLVNTGNANLVVSGVTVNSNFTNTGTGTCAGTPFTLTAGSSCTFIITFTPTSTIAYNGTLTVSDNATGSPHTVTLTGQGTAPIIQWTPTIYNFGNANVGTSVNSTTLTLQNIGTGPLNVLLSIGGANPTDFSIFSTTCVNGSQLAPGASCTAIATFTPLSAASFTASLTETDSLFGAASVALSGTGVTLPPPPSVAVAPWIPIIL